MFHVINTPTCWDHDLNPKWLKTHHIPVPYEFIRILRRRENSDLHQTTRRTKQLVSAFSCGSILFYRNMLIQLYNYTSYNLSETAFRIHQAYIVRN